MRRPTVGPEAVAEWCSNRLGSTPSRVLFESGFLSTVGVELQDGRKVVIKVRSPHDRIETCFMIHQLVWESGFPCPEPLVAPAPIGDLVATAESLVEGGEPLSRDMTAPSLSATALAWLLRVVPKDVETGALAPPPAWLWWDHPADTTWPWPDDRDVDLNKHQGPDWLEQIGSNVRKRLLGLDLKPVVGHCDWWSGNVRWSGESLHVVHDWDSVAARPEAAIVGAAAANFPATDPGTEATIEETEKFLNAYQQASARPFTRQEVEVAWAAGLWVRAFDSKKESLDTTNGPIQSSLRAEIGQRVRRAGISLS